MYCDGKKWLNKVLLNILFLNFTKFWNVLFVLRRDSSSFSDCFIGFRIVKLIVVTHSIHIVVDLSINALTKAEILRRKGVNTIYAIKI